MFSGIIQELGCVASIKREGEFASLVVRGKETAGKMKVGDSVSVNGVCLTAVKIEGVNIYMQVVFETLKRSTLGLLKTNDAVNLELALRYGDFVGGHLVQGHVDCTGKTAAKLKKKGGVLMGFKVTGNSVKYIVEKGSIAVDGISLTVADVKNEVFYCALIPHTLKVTTLGFKKVGSMVNIEVDMNAKYMENFIRNYFSGKDRK